MEFVHQPHGPIRIGQYLNDHFADQTWDEFRAAIAFAKRSGSRHIRRALKEFDGRAKVRISIGVDFFGTSHEGLEDLLKSTPNGEVWIFHNSGPYTFHPKIYLFKSTGRADLLVGSGNLTEGGLFTNYESSLAVSLDLAKTQDAAFLLSVEQVLNSWSQPVTGLCHVLTEAVLKQLSEAGLVRSEAQLAAIAQQVAIAAPIGRTASANAESTAETTTLFTVSSVPPAPHPLPSNEASEAAQTLAEVEAEVITRSVPVTHIVSDYVPISFVMILQNTDVGHGQTTPGTSRRSPEVFIPLAALDTNQKFWGFPDLFVADRSWDARHTARRNGLGKLDRVGVPMRVGMVRAVNMFFNPDKRDLRLRHESLRSGGNVGDIIWIQQVDPNNGFDYEVQVAPQGSPLFKQLEPRCDHSVANSLKRFGYF